MSKHKYLLFLFFASINNFIKRNHQFPTVIRIAHNQFATYQKDLSFDQILLFISEDICIDWCLYDGKTIVFILLIFL